MASALDPNRRLPDGQLKPEAAAHPEDFTRNTGEGAPIKSDSAECAPQSPDEAITPSDSPGG